MIFANKLLFSLFPLQKPEGWLDEEPEYVPDPNGVKPDDWDDDEDGEWEAPQIGKHVLLSLDLSLPLFVSTLT